MSAEERFWEAGGLSELTREQWESLCDGCGRCCLHKLADQDSGDVYYTDVACHLLDLERCRCSDYGRRHELMPSCVLLTPEMVRRATWLPATCAYRLRALGKPLPRWHHLRTGSREDVHRSGASIRGKAVQMAAPDDETLMARVVGTVLTDAGVRPLLKARGGPNEGEAI